MGFSAITAFLSYAVVNAFTPGPGNLLALNTMVRFGWRKSRRLLIGIFIGYYVVQVLCAILTYGLEQYFRPAIGVMEYVGATYIVWLAIHIARSKPSAEGVSKQPSLWVGCLLQLVNVKIYLFGITALTGYVLPFYKSFGMLLTFELLIATIGTAATLLWAFLGGTFQNVYKKHFHIVNIVLTIILLECAVSMVFV